jgi:hypothetical protein
MHKKYSEFVQIQRMWDAASDALQNCTTFSTFGFSFPTSDCLISDVVRRAFSRSKALGRIIVIDVNPNAVIARIKELVPPLAPVTIYPLTVPKDGSDPPWLSKSLCGEVNAA